MQQFKVAGGGNRRRSAIRGALEARSLEELARLLPTGQYATIAELGSGTCSLAPYFFTGKPPAHYRCFESDSSLREKFRAPRGVTAEQLTLSAFEPAQGLPLPNASQDLLLTCHYLEYLRMDELYMISHEARRCLKPGATWALAGLTLAHHPLRKLWQRWQHPGQALDLNHYISPEDWRVRSEKTFLVNGLAGQVIQLERLAAE